jgi:DNA-binding transcriptional MerR regulator
MEGDLSVKWSEILTSDSAEESWVQKDVATKAASVLSNPESSNEELRECREKLKAIRLVRAHEDEARVLASSEARKLMKAGATEEERKEVRKIILEMCRLNFWGKVSFRGDVQIDKRMEELKTLLNHIKGGIREREATSNSVKNLSSKMQLKYLNLDEVKEILEEASSKILKLSFDISIPKKEEVQEEVQKEEIEKEEDELKQAVKEAEKALQKNSLPEMRKAKEKLEGFLKIQDPMVKVGLRDWIKELDTKIRES